MAHSIHYNPEERIVEIKIQGVLTLKETNEIMGEVVPIVKAENCFLMLNDIREATLGLTVLDLYELPKLILEIMVSSGFSIRKLKRAILISKDVKEFLFFETVNFNRGLRVKLFRDIDEARKWLQEK